MYPRHTRYECPKCGRRESYSEGCVKVPRICHKCKITLVAKEINLGATPKPKEILDVFLNLFK